MGRQVSARQGARRARGLPGSGALIRKRVVVTGRVQGVGFRFAVARRAEERGLSGWVRNEHDGSVAAVFEGEPDAVDELVRFCHEGPRGAAIERVQVSDEEPESLHAFEIR